MSAVKVDNAWLKILSIKIKDNGVWIDHHAIYAKHSGDWYLIDLGAEASGPAIYLWKAYADDDQGNGISLSPTNKSFIGFSAGHESETVDLSDPSIFDWTQLKFYTWRAYADDNQGAGISLNSTEKEFIGIAYNQSTQSVDISDPSIFSWTSSSGGLNQSDVDTLIDSAFDDFIASDHNQQAIVTINGIIDQFNADLDAETADLVRKTDIDLLEADIGETYATQLALSQVVAEQNQARATSVEAIEANLNDNFATKVSLSQVESTADGAAESVAIVRGAVEHSSSGLSATYSLAQGASQTANGLQSSVTSLTNTVGNSSAGLVQQVNSVSARTFLGVNSSNRITGVFIDGSATESSIALQADKVSFVTPGGVSKLYWSGSDLVFDGTLRIGGTSLTASNTLNSNTQWSEVNSRPTNLAGLDSSASSKLAGIANNADVTNYSDYRVTNSSTVGGFTTIKNPQGASLSNGSSGPTGSIVVWLPVGYTNTMMKMVVDVYNYNTTKSMTLAVGGYNHTSGWVNEFAQIMGSTSGNNRVRFGHNGSKCCIIIGDESDTWSYPKINVRDFNAGYSNYAISTWDSGWSIQILSSLSGITITGDISNALLDAKAIVGQGALATKSAADWSSDITGSGKPANNADVTNYNDTRVSNTTAANNANVAAKTAGTVGGWNISSVAMWSGAYQASNAFTTSGMTLHKDGAIRAKEFRIDTDGSAFFQGDIEGAKGSFGRGLYSAYNNATLKVGYAGGANVNEATLQYSSGGSNYSLISCQAGVLRLWASGTHTIDMLGHTNLAGILSSYTVNATASGSNNGVKGKTTSGSYQGVLGEGTAKGVKGTASNSSGIGVEGAGGTSGQGVKGTGNIGVLGEGTNTGVEGSGNSTGVRGEGPYGVTAIGTSYDFYAFGSGANYGPFTGAHDGLLDKTITPLEVGDLLCEGDLFNIKNVSNTLTSMVPSAASQDPTVAGIYVNSIPIDTANLPASMDDDMSFLSLNYDRVIYNAIGEGAMNVCGEGGDIVKGDLICSSNMRGKGMKQSDSIIRNYTVAKARQNVTFSSVDEVQQIAVYYYSG